MNNDELTTVSHDALSGVTGGGWKSKVVKAAWETAKWTGIPSAIGAGAAWVQHQFGGTRAPEAPPPPPSNQP